MDVKEIVRRLSAHSEIPNLHQAEVTHLVDVHVGLSAGSGLEDDEREVFDELSADDLGAE